MLDKMKWRKEVHGEQEAGEVAEGLLGAPEDDLGLLHAEGVLGLLEGEGVLGLLEGEGVLGLLEAEGVLGVLEAEGVLGVLEEEGVLGPQNGDAHGEAKEEEDALGEDANCFDGWDHSYEDAVEGSGRGISWAHNA